MFLLELSGNPNAPTFGPTPKFRKIYGNYCGPGNKGGEPIDAVDDACRLHDMCYHYQGYHECGCDKKFILKLDDLLKGKLTLKQRYITNLMKAYFKKKVNKPCPQTDK